MNGEGKFKIVSLQELTTPGTGRGGARRFLVRFNITAFDEVHSIVTDGMDAETVKRGILEVVKFRESLDGLR